MSALRSLFFPLLVVGLGALAIVALRLPPRAAAGLPADADAARARDLAHGIAAGAGSLRFRSELLGDSAPPDSGRAAPNEPAPGERNRLALAERHLLAAQRRHPLDPRLTTALGSVDLASLRLERAERRYREALDLAPGCAEARLGLGIALAIEADGEGDADRARGLRMRATSQLLAVPERTPERRAALYDLAIVMLRSGATAKAAAWAREYWARDSTSAWASRLHREFGVLPG